MLINFNHLKTFWSALAQKLKNHRGNWNQNDSTADDYIKNRPFYSEGVKETIIVDTVVNTDSTGMDSSGPIIYQALIEDSSFKPFKIGQEYTVIWDGKTYKCIAQDLQGIGAIGNLSYLGYMGAISYEDTGEPFMIGVESGYGMIVCSEDMGSHTLVIKIVEEVIHKLDKKFIDMPDGIVTEDSLATILDDTLAPVSFTNSYDSLSNKPTVYTDVVRYGTSQSLTAAQKTQSRTNIGAAYSSDVTTLTNGVVRHDIAQSLTDTQKTQARANIGASDFSGDYFDLENKPCDKIVVEDVALVSNQTVTVTASSTPILLTSLDVVKGFNKTNCTYTIVINNNTYKGLNVRDDRTICNGGYLGNLYIYNSSAENTGESFVVYAMETVIDTDLYFATRDESLIGTTVTVTVIQEGGTTYIPLEDGYIPDSVKYASAEASRTITWDGDITDRDSVEFKGNLYYKVSDIYFATKNIISIENQVMSNGGNGQNDDYVENGVRILGNVIIADAAGVYKIYILPDIGMYSEITVPSAGIYFECVSDYIYTKSATITYNARSIPSDVVGVVRTVNDIEPDVNGNVTLDIPDNETLATKDELEALRSEIISLTSSLDEVKAYLDI